MSIITTISRMLVATAMLIACANVKAQFNPVNPAEPYVYYKVSVSTVPTGIAYTSGNGSYLSGTSIYINASLYNGNYRFTHWTLNGDTVSQSTSFYYTVLPEKANLVAHYLFEPPSPEEPTTIVRNELYLEASPHGACSFNRTSGNKVSLDDYVYLQPFPNQGYEFKGWYEGATLVSRNPNFNYSMPGRKVTLTAHYVYNPANPADPSGSGQTNINTRLKGDINKDNVVDVTDVVAIINGYLDNNTDEAWIAIADLNGDGVVDVTDAVIVLNIHLNNN